MFGYGRPACDPPNKDKKENNLSPNPSRFKKSLSSTSLTKSQQRLTSLHKNLKPKYKSFEIPKSKKTHNRNLLSTSKTNRKRTKLSQESKNKSPIAHSSASNANAVTTASTSSKSYSNLVSSVLNPTVSSALDLNAVPKSEVLSKTAVPNYSFTKPSTSLPSKSLDETTLLASPTEILPPLATKSHVQKIFSMFTTSPTAPVTSGPTVKSDLPSGMSSTTSQNSQFRSFFTTSSASAPTKPPPITASSKPKLFSLFSTLASYMPSSLGKTTTAVFASFKDPRLRRIMAETSGIIIFTLWYLAIAFNYFMGWLPANIPPPAQSPAPATLPPTPGQPPPPPPSTPAAGPRPPQPSAPKPSTPAPK